MAGQVWAVNTAGGYFYSNQLSNVLRTAVQPLTKFRQFCDGEQVFGKHRGQTFTWDVVSDVANPGGVLAETNTMPQTNFTIAQGTLTVTEYGNAVPWTGLVEELGKFDVAGPVGKTLKNDCAKTLDRAAWAQFRATPQHFIASSGTDAAALQFYTNGTVTGTNSVALGTAHLKNLVDTMKANNIPAFLGDDYYAIANVATLRAIKNSLETLHSYSATGLDLIMRGEIGRYENTRFIEQTNIAAGIGATGIASSQVGGDMAAWTNGKSDWCFFMGEDTVYEGVVEPEQLRYQIAGDYGRSKGMAWYALLGFGLIQTQASQARIYMWDSAK